MMFVAQQIRRRQGVQGLGEYTLAVNVVGRLPAGGLWGQAFSKVAAALGPVGWAISAGFAVYSLVRLFQAWHERGELKIKATAKAEEFVSAVWGTLKPNSPPEEDSISKKIEECKLNEAQSMITFIARQMYEAGNRDQFLKRWVDEWGMVTLRQIQSKLDAYLGYCSNSNQPVQPEPSQPIKCPPGFEYTGTRCTPLQCPNGFYLNNGRCEMISPPTLPPAIDDSGQYVPLPQATASKTGLFALLALALAAVVISR